MRWSASRGRSESRPEVIARMAPQPRSALQAVAHTLVYDCMISDATSLELLTSVTAPVRVIDSEGSIGDLTGWVAEVSPLTEGSFGPAQVLGKLRCGHQRVVVADGCEWHVTSSSLAHRFRCARERAGPRWQSSSALDLMRVSVVPCHAMNAPRALRQVIGARVKHLREQAGGRQEDIARVARSFGLAWPRQKVDELERGKKAISAEELVLLPFVLSHALDRAVSMAHLFDDDDRITLSAQTDIPARDVLAELCGAKPAGTFVNLTHLPSFDAVEVIARAFGRPVRRMEALGLDQMSSRALLAVERSSGEPEARAARQVGEGSIVFTAICYHLWGRSLSTERDARVAASLPNAAPASTVRAKRGRVTRELVAEIRAFITRAEES